jgi:hypothetical protein
MLVHVGCILWEPVLSLMNQKIYLYSFNNSFEECKQSEYRSMIFTQILP